MTDRLLKADAKMRKWWNAMQSPPPEFMSDLLEFEAAVREDERHRIIANDSAGKESEPVLGCDHITAGGALCPCEEAALTEPYRLEKINRRIRP